MIEKLTSKQKALIPIIRDEWIKIALDTSPTDKQKAEAAIYLTYEGYKPPQEIFWFDNPLAAVIWIASNRKHLGDYFQSNYTPDIVSPYIPKTNMDGIWQIHELAYYAYFHAFGIDCANLTAWWHLRKNVAAGGVLKILQL